MTKYTETCVTVELSLMALKKKKNRKEKEGKSDTKVLLLSSFFVHALEFQHVV